MSRRIEQPWLRQIIARTGLVTTQWRQWFEVIARPAETRIESSTAYDPPSINAGNSADVTVAMAFIRRGDPVMAGFTEAHADVSILAHCAADGEVTVRFVNYGGAPVDMPPGSIILVAENV